MSKLIRSRLEKDFEFFVKNLPTLEPVEFCGLAKILSVPLVKQEALIDLTKEQLEGMDEEEKTKIVAEATRPIDEVLEQMMDRYLELPKHRRKEINSILKELKHDNMNKNKKKKVK